MRNSLKRKKCKIVKKLTSPDGRENLELFCEDLE